MINFRLIIGCLGLALIGVGIMWLAYLDRTEFIDRIDRMVATDGVVVAPTVEPTEDLNIEHGDQNGDQNGDREEPPVPENER